MSRYTIFMDVSGRIARSIDGHQFTTIGGVSLETEKLESALNNLPKDLPKWEGSTINDVKKVTEYIRENAIYVAAVCLDKKTEQWPLFWDDADSYHQKIASASKMRTGFVKAANVIRYWLFGQCSAPLIAETIKRAGMPKVLDSNGLGIVEVNIVCDSDIQGTDNISAFKSCLEQFEKSQKKTNSLGLRMILKDLKIDTEQNEPLILLADYIAGICNSLFGAGKISAPAGLNLNDTKAELDKVKDSGKIVVIKKSFDLNYREIFSNFEAI